MFILMYIAFFAWCGQMIFKGTIEGVEQFDTFYDGFFNMFVFMTTANYPDVMLPAYRRNRTTAIFFIVYEILILFLFLKLLLAIFYSNYQQKVEQQIDEFDEERTNFVEDLYNSLDKDKKGYLNKLECQGLVSEIHLIIKKKED